MGDFNLVAAVSGAMLAEGLKNMIVGLGVVFAILILLCVIIWLFKFLDRVGFTNEAAKAPDAPAFAPAPRKSSEAGTMSESVLDFEDVDADVSAAILGAIAEECGGNFQVTSIKKSK